MTHICKWICPTHTSQVENVNIIVASPFGGTFGPNIRTPTCSNMLLQTLYNICREIAKLLLCRHFFRTTAYIQCYLGYSVNSSFSTGDKKRQQRQWCLHQRDQTARLQRATRPRDIVAFYICSGYRIVGLACLCVGIYFSADCNEVINQNKTKTCVSFTVCERNTCHYFNSVVYRVLFTAFVVGVGSLKYLSCVFVVVVAVCVTNAAAAAGGAALFLIKNLNANKGNSSCIFL